ncbi:MAG: ATP-binding protein [Clostridiales bacterium]|nr:ATP-binding protein [Clostridiales bacterium]
MTIFEVAFSSNIKEVKKIVRCAQNYISEMIPSIDAEELLDLRLILSELLFNAVIHGNKNNSEKMVRLKIKITGNTINAVISDQGNGFDFSRLSYTNNEASSEEHGRGISLVNALVDSLSFAKPGNIIMFCKKVGSYV